MPDDLTDGQVPMEFDKITGAIVVRGGNQNDKVVRDEPGLGDGEPTVDLLPLYPTVVGLRVRPDHDHIGVQEVVLFGLIDHLIDKVF